MASSTLPSLAALQSALEQVEARAAELRQSALAERSEAQSKDVARKECADARVALEAELEEQRRLISEAINEISRLQSTLAGALEQAAKDVKSLTKQQLEEVRSLSSPAPIIRRALALVYFILHPQDVSTFPTLDDVPWKTKLAPMLRRDDLIRRLAEYPPVDSIHPLIQFPALATFIEAQIAQGPGAASDDKAQANASSDAANSPSRRSSMPVRKLVRGSIAVRSAARLLKASSLDMESVSDSSSWQVGGGAAPTGGGVASRQGSVTDLHAFQRTSSKGSLLLGDSDRLTLEAVSYASQAVGQLFQWVLSQLRYVRTLKDEGLENVQVKVASIKEEKDQLFAGAVVIEGNVESTRVKEEALAAEMQEANRRAEQCDQEAVKKDQEVVSLQQQIEALRNRVVTPPPPPTPPEPEVESSLEATLSKGTVKVAPIEVEVRERVNFTSGSACLSSFANRAIHGVVSVMNDNDDLMLCVEGHSRPGEADSLSSMRANAVLEQLVKQGVPRHRLRAAGFGSSFPAGDNDTSSGDNARVEFSVIQEISIKGTVQFGPCSTNLTRQSEPLLTSVAALLNARPCLRVRVEGHTDNAPYFGSNIELAEDRAKSVIDFLGKQGVQVDQLVPVGFGEKIPKAPNSSQSGRATNRRVEFHILQRETVKGVREMLKESQHKGQIDVAALQQLERTATGAAVGLALPIRVAAADMLARLHADWQIQRLLYIASQRDDPGTCLLAMLPSDCVRRVLRFYFLLGCSTLTEKAEGI